MLHSLEQEQPSQSAVSEIANRKPAYGFPPSQMQKVSQSDSRWLALVLVSPTGRCIDSGTPPLPILKHFPKPISAEEIYRGAG